MLRYAYSLPDNSVHIVTSAPREHIQEQLGCPYAPSDHEYETFVLFRSIPDEAVEVARLPDDWQTPDRSARSAWRLRDGRITVEQ